MSLRAVLWAFDEAPTGDKSEVLVLLALADDADDTGGSCYPSLERVAGRARMSVSGARRALQRLEESGLISVQRPERQGRGQHNRYQLHLEMTRDNTKEGSHGDTHTGEERCTKGVISTDKGAQRVASGARIPVDPKPVNPRRLQISERRDYPDPDVTATMLEQRRAELADPDRPDPRAAIAEARKART